MWKTIKMSKWKYSENVLYTVWEDVKGKIYILPSSVFETILVVDDEETDEKQLKRMVEEINGEWKDAAPEEWLSDSVYYYDREDDEVKIAA